MDNNKYNEMILADNRATRLSRLLSLLAFFIFLVLLLIATAYIFWGWEGLANQWQRNLNNIYMGMIHPNWQLFTDLRFNSNPQTGIIPATLTTIFMSVIGTLIGLLIALPLGIKGSINLNGKKAYKYKRSFAMMRTFPSFIIAIMMLVIVGPTAFAGTIAIGLASVGMLGKLISETVEEMDMGIVEAMESTGATRRQIIWRGVIPYIYSNLVSIAMYRLDINVRDSIMIGIVGAGGMGTAIILALQSQNWSDVFMWTYATIVVVIAIEVISNKYRQKLRND